MTSTANGDYLYVGEGGAIAAIEADATNPPVADYNYQNPLWRDPVGSLGVQPVKMLLDPDAATVPANGTNDILYIAGGRDGLWAMEADVTADGVPNRAVRIDDSGNEINVSTQFNRKWCNDLSFITLGEGTEEKTYLLALFGKTDNSRLRIYELDRVRTAFNAGRFALPDPEEFGHEILPDKGVRLGRQLAIAAATNGKSFAFGMDIDDENDDVYVAMGFHGLGRVHLDLNGTLLSWSLQWGPFFGDGSDYRQIDTDLYRDVEIYEGGNLVARYSPTFLDVAVDLRVAQDRWVYAAVDHLGVVGFSLEAPWNGYIYSPTSTVFHQEGRRGTDGAGHFWSQLVDGDPENVCSTFARRIQVVESASALVVTTMTRPFLAYPGILNMGRRLGWNLGSLGGLPLVIPWTMAWDHGYTIAYDLTARGSWDSYPINAAAVAEIGRQMFVHPEQQPDSLSFFAGPHAPGRFTTSPETMPGTAADHELHRIEFLGTWPPSGVPPAPPLTPDRDTIREGASRPGRWNFRTSLNLANPEVLVTGSNDAGLAADGPLVLDLTVPGGAKIRAHFDPGPGDEDRRDGTHGMTYEPDAALERNGYEYRLAYRACPPAGGPRWRLSKVDGGTNVTDQNTTDRPRELKVIFFTMPDDKFLSRGDYYYGGAGYSPEYAVDVDENYIFTTNRHTPQGVHVLDFDELISFIDDDVNTTNGDNLDLSDDLWDSALVGEFTTHPEFWEIDECRVDPHELAAEDFLVQQEIDSMVVTFPPQFIKLPSEGIGGVPDTWVLAVPSGYAACDENLLIFSSHARWAPRPKFQTTGGFSKLMVRFFDISDKDRIALDYDTDQTASSTLPGFTILGPDAESSGMFLRTLEMEVGTAPDEEHRCFVFVVDLGGHVYVYDITEMLTWEPDFDSSEIHSHLHYGATRDPQPFATYEPPDSLSSDQTCNVMDVEIDQASWTDDQLEEHNEVYVYVSVPRVGIDVLRFEPTGTTSEERLVPVTLIQTPGQTGFLTLCNSPYSSSLDEYGYVRDKLLLVSDRIAGLRIYTYNFEG